MAGRHVHVVLYFKGWQTTLFNQHSICHTSKWTNIWPTTSPINNFNTPPDIPNAKTFHYFMRYQNDTLSLIENYLDVNHCLYNDWTCCIIEIRRHSSYTYCPYNLQSKNPTFPASEARCASSASRSSETGNHLLLLFALTGNPLISRKWSRPISARTPPSHSCPLMAASSRNCCSCCPGCGAAASRVVLTNHRMSEKWTPIRQQAIITRTKHDRRQTCSCAPIFHRRSKWTILSHQALIWKRPFSFQFRNMLSNRSKTPSQLHISSLQLAVKQLPTFVASEARYASNASRSSGIVNHFLLLFALTGNPAAVTIARKSSLQISATAPCRHSSPFLAPSCTNRCSFSRGCDMTRVGYRTCKKRVTV